LEGLEYLHSKGISHTDISPKHLLIGEDLKLKISNFERCCLGNSRNVEHSGTENCRGPEMKEGTASDPIATDIYSVGIILFLLRTGVHPYKEEEDED